MIRSSWQRSFIWGRCVACCLCVAVLPRRSTAEKCPKVHRQVFVRGKSPPHSTQFPPQYGKRNPMLCKTPSSLLFQDFKSSSAVSEKQEPFDNIQSTCREFLWACEWTHGEKKLPPLIHLKTWKPPPPKRLICFYQTENLDSSKVINVGLVVLKLSSTECEVVQSTRGLLAVSGVKETRCCMCINPRDM